MSTFTNNQVTNYDLTLMEEFAAQVAEFFRLPIDIIHSRLDKELYQHSGVLVAEAWQQANPQTPEEVTQFYQETDSYVYDLVADHCHVRRNPVRQAVIQRIEQRGSRQDVLVYGDGIGADSIMLAKRGHQVTYFDLPSVTSDFALFRFKNEGLEHKITVVTSAKNIPEGKFDAVVCIEVLEHVPNPPAIMRELFLALKYGGIALITESFESVGPEYPSHLPENLQYAGRTHQLMEYLGFANTYNHLDPVNRPMEFLKIQPNSLGNLQKLKGRLVRAGLTRWRRVRQATQGFN